MANLTPDPAPLLVRPCPFCEGQPAHLKLPDGYEAFACSECGMIGPAAHSEDEDGTAHALELWNQRGKSAALGADAETCVLASVLEATAAKLYRNEFGSRDGALFLLLDSKSKHLAAHVHRLDEAGVKWLVQQFVRSIDEPRTPAGLIIPAR